MIEIRKTDVFARWLDDLADLRARARIQARIERLALGNAGDVKPAGEGVSELRIDYGPGYRVYFKRRGRRGADVVCGSHTGAGGDKSSQARDIKRAQHLARDLAE